MLIQGSTILCLNWYQKRGNLPIFFKKLALLEQDVGAVCQMERRAYHSQHLVWGGLEKQIRQIWSIIQNDIIIPTQTVLFLVCIYNMNNKSKMSPNNTRHTQNADAASFKKLLMAATANVFLHLNNTKGKRFSVGDYFQLFHISFKRRYHHWLATRCIIVNNQPSCSWFTTSDTKHHWYTR